MASSTQTVTLLFTDMVGSTALLSSLDPETADRVRQEHFSVLRQALASCDGVEVKNLGDGLMAVFATSSAAIACGVAMQQGVEQENRRSQQTLGLRVGLSGGEVTVEDDDFFGDPVIEAARVCALCDGGQILVTDSVRFMVGRRSSHPLEPRGDHELKGLPDPVALFEIRWAPLTDAVATGVVPLPERLEPHTGDFGFFGRDRETAELLDALKAGLDGSRQVALVAGEPGIGKTSLCRQVAAQAHELGVCVLYGRCDEDLGLSYQPFAEALSHLVVHVDDGVLTRHVAEHGAILSGLVPALATRLPDLPVPQSADPDTERARLLNAIVGLLASTSSNSGMFVVLDDLHWADKATLQLLRHLAGSSQLMNVMFLGTYRDSDLSAGDALSDALASMRRDDNLTRIDLVGLADHEILEMMEAAAGHVMAEDGVALAHAVRRETEGNPFFTGEMLRHLSESGLVRQSEDGRWVASEDLYERGLPQSVRDVVGQRVDRLGTEHRRVLTFAAVIGRDFDLDLLADVADVSEDTVIDILDDAIAAGLVTEVEGALDRFSFAHALTQHTLYDDLGASRRARAHRAVAHAIEDLAGSALEARAGELAHHYVAATKTADAVKALTYSQMAGEQALKQLAPVDALEWFAQALDLYEQVTPDRAVHCELLIGLGIAQRQTGDGGHRETLLRAASIAKDMGDPDRLVRAALENNIGGAGADAGHVDLERVAVLEDAITAVGERDSVLRARLLATLCTELTYTTDTQRLAELSREALALARRLDDPLTFLRVVNAVYVSFAMPDSLEDRLRDFVEAVAIAATIGDPAASYHAHYGCAVACSQAGDRFGFDEHFGACIALAAQLDQPYEYWSVACLRAGRAALDGDLEAAEELMNAALGIGAEGIPEALTVYGGQLGAIRFLQGRLDEIIDLFADAAADNPDLAVLRASMARNYCVLDRRDDAAAMIEGDLGDGFVRFPYDITWVFSMTLLAEACTKLGDDAAAELLYGQLLPWEAQVAAAGPNIDGPIAFYLGILACTLGRHDDAERHFAAALAMAEDLRGPYCIARTQLEWATMLLQFGRTDAQEHAESMIASAGATARNHGFEALERQAAALRD